MEFGCGPGPPGLSCRLHLVHKHVHDRAGPASSGAVGIQASSVTRTARPRGPGGRRVGTRRLLIHKLDGWIWRENAGALPTGQAGRFCSQVKRGTLPKIPGGHPPVQPVKSGRASGARAFTPIFGILLKQKLVTSGLSPPHPPCPRKAAYIRKLRSVSAVLPPTRSVQAPTTCWRRTGPRWALLWPLQDAKCCSQPATLTAQGVPRAHCSASLQGHSPSSPCSQTPPTCH